MGNFLGLPEDPEPGNRGLEQNGTHVTSGGRPAIDSMAVHVKEVLPQVPIEVIRKDLTVTANVDETITRLLDGTVTYQPEKKPPASAATAAAVRSPTSTPAAGSLQSCAITHPPLITAASSFGKSADERHKSFEERKQKLIEESKRRYLAKQELLKPNQSEASGSVN